MHTFRVKCRNCGEPWVHHSSDAIGPYCIRTYRPEDPPEGVDPASRSWLAALTQRQVTLITRISEAAVIAIIIGLLLTVLDLKK